MVFSEGVYQDLKKKERPKILGCRVNLSQQEVFPGNYFGVSLITFFDDGSEYASLDDEVRVNLNDYNIEFEGPVILYGSNKKFIVLQVEGDIQNHPKIGINVTLKSNSDICFNMEIPIQFAVDYDINFCGTGGKSGKSFISYTHIDPVPNNLLYDKQMNLYYCITNCGANDSYSHIYKENSSLCNKENSSYNQTGDIGKNGKDGTSGNHAYHAEIYITKIKISSQDILKIEVRRSDSKIFCRYLSTNEGSFMIDARGGNGGHGGHGANAYIGGDGGNAGNGGDGGNVSYYFTNETWVFKDRFHVFNPGGKAGIPGHGGNTYIKGKNGSSANDGKKGSVNYVLID